MPRPIFELGPRLAACAKLVRFGVPVADIGTDHGYLPVWLVKTGKTPKAIAADINPGPLKAAMSSCEKYDVSDRIELRLSDGLKNIEPWEVLDIVIAGMGGELILQIIRACLWTRDKRIRLVLQPMSSVAELREGLYKNGFNVYEEYAVIENGKVYSAFSASYTGRAVIPEPVFLYMGKLQAGSAESEKYAKKIIGSLDKKITGLVHEGKREEAEALQNTVNKIKEKYVPEDT